MRVSELHAVLIRRLTQEINAILALQIRESLDSRRARVEEAQDTEERPVADLSRRLQVFYQAINVLLDANESVVLA